MEFYGLEGTHWGLLQMVAPSHFHISIFDEDKREISYYPKLQANPQPESDSPVEEFFTLAFEGTTSTPLAETDVDTENEELIPATTDVAQVVPPEYDITFSTILTPYRAYGSQYVRFYLFLSITRFFMCLINFCFFKDTPPEGCIVPWRAWY